MEVFMLAWLSKDPILGELCEKPDIYFSLYETLIGVPPKEKSDRELIKKMFLPVIYGQSPYMLGQRCNIPKDTAESIVNRIYSSFPVVSSWIKNQQEQLQNLGFAKDVFNKRRTFDEDKQYLVRNFCIQAPAAVVCLEKLNHLYFALNDKTDIAYTVHDGYAVYANKNNWKEIYNIGKEVLSGVSDFCPNLRLKVTCRGGRNLNDLKIIKQ
jgi:DNA polymerase I-like protein with 3'-5' exonuclease and polymerase domains